MPVTSDPALPPHIHPYFVSVAPTTWLTEVIERMSQVRGSGCTLSSLDWAIMASAMTNPDLEEPIQKSLRSSCALVVDADRLVGIFTERDLVKLAAAGRSGETLQVKDVMSHPVKTLPYREAQDIFMALSALRRHRVRHLPVLGDDARLLGVITLNSIRRALQPLNFLKLKRVQDQMVRQVISAAPTDSVLTLAQTMTQHRVSCVVIVREQNSDPGGGASDREHSLPETRHDVPVGIITEGDIVQFQALGLSLSQLQADSVMSTPLFPVHPKDSLWSAHCQMQQRRVRRLVVTQEHGHLVGIITQTSILHGLDPMELLGSIDELQHMVEAQTAELRHTNTRLHREIRQKQQLETALHQANTALERRIDLTLAELEQAETDLHSTQQRLQYLIKSSPTLIYSRRPNRDYGMISISQNISTVLGYEVNDFLRDPDYWITKIHPEDITIACELGKPNQLSRHFRLRHRDGTYRWILDQFNVVTDSDHNPIEVIGYWLDVTDRKKAELERDRFVNLSLDMLCVAGVDGYFKQINPAFQRVLGYQEDELLSQPLLNFVHPEDRQPTLDAIEQLAGGENVVAFENRYRRRDGSYCWLMWSAVPFEEEQKIYAVARDITEKKYVEEELRRQSRYDHLLADVTSKVRRSLQLPTILQTTVQEVKQVLDCDRVLIARLQFNGTTVMIQEAIQAGWKSMLNIEVKSPVPQLSIEDTTETRSVQNIIPVSLLQQFAITDQLALPISVREHLWGFLIVQQCDRRRIWEQDEENLLQQLADQLGIAISQSQLLQHLEELVEQRTTELSSTNHSLHQEIQDRIAIEAELRENEQKLAGILDTADEAIISIDRRQTIQIFNQGAERIFGYEQDEVLGQPLSLLLPEAQRSIHQQHVEDFSDSTHTSRQMGSRREIWGRRKNGEIFEAEASISRLPTRGGLLFTAILKDISERREAEQALQRSQSLLQKIIDNSPSIISVMDLNHRHLLVNRSYADLLPMPQEALIGRSVREVWPAEIADTMIENNTKTLTSNSPLQAEETLPQSDGPHTYLSSIFPLQSECGEPYAICSISTDISSRKLIEQLKDEFISVVSHELRTPLTSIHGSLKLLSTGRLGDLTPEGQEVLDIAAENTERLIRLVGDVLNLERIQSGDFQLHKTLCDASKLLTQAMNMMRPMADQQSITFSVNSSSIPFWAVPDLILQTLTNLISNAIKFSPDHTTIQLEVTNSDTEVLFQITDRGRGIPADKLQIIFERFQQVDASDSRSKGGTGLGLAICRNIVEKHGGRIWVQSILGQGSTFYFTIPHIPPETDDNDVN